MLNERLKAEIVRQSLQALEVRTCSHVRAAKKPLLCSTDKTETSISKHSLDRDEARVARSYEPAHLTMLDVYVNSTPRRDPTVP
jgi:hypothetical protein